MLTCARPDEPDPARSVEALRGHVDLFLSVSGREDAHQLVGLGPDLVFEVGRVGQI